jgi:hypothetical protein
MSKNLITNDEVLYRRVTREYKEQAGVIKISSQAFYTSSFRPSVDRAKLRTNNPYKTLGDHAGGVVSLVTGDVRSINVPIRNSEKEHFTELSVDVEYAPIFNEPGIEDNDAHAEIYVKPICDKKAFRILIEKLALLANARGWEIKPQV